MTIPKDKEIPPQADAGNTGNSDQPLSDASLEQLTGGVEDAGVDLDVVEGSIRLKPGSDTPIADK